MVQKNPRLLLFPCLSFVGTLVMIAFFLAPVLIEGVERREIAPVLVALGGRINVISVGYGAVIYLIAMLVGTFFNVAFYHQILAAFSGDTVSVKVGMSFALRRLGAIVMWTLLAGTVGWLVRAIEERLGWVGKIVMGLVGVTWSVAAVFAIPVIIRQEDCNPLAVLRASAATLKKAWGESLIGFIGMQMVGLAFFAVMLVAMLGETFLFFSTDAMWLIVAIDVAWLAIVIALIFLLDAATAVYRCALYIYASEGVVPEPYTIELMDAAWKVKKV